MESLVGDERGKAKGRSSKDDGLLDIHEKDTYLCLQLVSPTEAD